MTIGRSSQALTERSESNGHLLVAITTLRVKIASWPRNHPTRRTPGRGIVRVGDERRRAGAPAQGSYQPRHRCHPERSRRSGRSRRDLLFRAITGDTALRVAHFFGTSPEFWLNLQSLYEIRLAERKSGKSIKTLPTLQRGTSRASLISEPLASHICHRQANVGYPRGIRQQHSGRER